MSAASKPRYRVVREATDSPEVGNLVRSTGSPYGAIWRIEAIEERRYGHTDKPHLRIFMRSLSSGRQDDRHAARLVIVEEIQ